MFHPGYLMREYVEIDGDCIPNPGVEQHREEHIPAARRFLEELGLASPPTLEERSMEESFEKLKPLALSRPTPSDTVWAFSVLEILPLAKGRGRGLQNNLNSGGKT